jgi:hypothetical protein
VEFYLVTILLGQKMSPDSQNPEWRGERDEHVQPGPPGPYNVYDYTRVPCFGYCLRTKSAR